MSFDEMLERYAEVIVKVGLNVQKGQRLLIWSAPYDAAPLVRAITRWAYQVGARYVGTIYEDLDNLKAWLAYGDENSYEEHSLDDMETLRKYGERGDALLLIKGNDPDYLKNYEKSRVQKFQAGMSKNLGIYRGLIGGGEINRCVVYAPTQEYADVVMPDVPQADRLEKMWELVFHLCRINGDDPIINWQRHVENLAVRSSHLNQKQFDALRFRGPGTDLTVGLPAGHVWFSGQKKSKTGIPYVANIPTEEVFTLTDRTRLDGIVQATRPLSYGGATVADFSLTFDKGRVVEVFSKSGEEDKIKNYLNTDENASYTGEVALVANSSPVSQSGRIFYSILYDENSASHIALGAAYRMCLKDGTRMSDEEFLAAGGNISKLHLDFMVGSGEMDVDGLTRDGGSEPVMRAGEWVDVN